MFKLCLKGIQKLFYKTFCLKFRHNQTHSDTFPLKHFQFERNQSNMESKAVEILRDILDKTNIPVVLVGMTSANSRLKKFSHLYDRLSEIVKFEKFSKNDIKTIIKELSDIEMTDCTIRYIYSHFNRFRQIVKIINKAENMVRANGLNSIDEILIKEAIVNETENPQADKDSE